MRPLLRWLTYITFGLATIHFARCYVMLAQFYITLGDYAAGTAKMPFQGRMLMMWPMRWAERNVALERFASHRVGALKTPDFIVVTAVAIAALAATGFVLMKLYRQASRLQLFPWMPYTLLLMIAFFEYILHSEQNFLYSYDLLSLLFFTTGIWLIYTRRFWPLLLMFPIATLNRETVIFLVPLLALDACCEGERVEWKNLLRPSLVAKCLLLSAIWVAIELYVHHRFIHNTNDTGSHLSVNLVYLTHIQYWPQLLSIGAFLPLFVWYFWRDIDDFRLRMYCWIFPAWFAVMFYYGMLVETRIFGELGGLLALACTLIFERAVWSLVKGRLAKGVAEEI